MECFLSTMMWCSNERREKEIGVETRCVKKAGYDGPKGQGGLSRARPACPTVSGSARPKPRSPLVNSGPACDFPGLGPCQSRVGLDILINKK